MNTTRVEFPSPAGHTLNGLLDHPEGDPIAYALFAHCFTCGKSLRVIRLISEQMTANGISLLRFDFTGLGQSEGEFAETSFTTNLDDLEAAAQFLEREHAPARALIGHSLGGAAALAVADRLDSVRCVATIAAPSEPTHVRHLLAGADFDARNRAQVSIGGRPFEIGRGFVEDLESHDLAADIGALRRPLLVFHGPTDAIVGIEHAERIFNAARHPRSFVSLGQADHLVSEERDARFLGHVLAAWARRYIETA